MSTKKRRNIGRKSQVGSILLLRGIDPNIKRVFKALCAANDISMTRKIEQLMKRELNSSVPANAKR